MKSSTTDTTKFVCSGCGATSLLAREIHAIQTTGLCFDCAPESGLVDELTAAITSALTKPVPTVPEPSFEQLMEWEAEGYCEATDGCHVEADGTCPHGHRSWLLHLGYI